MRKERIPNLDGKYRRWTPRDISGTRGAIRYRRTRVFLFLSLSFSSLSLSLSLSLSFFLPFSFFWREEAGERGYNLIARFAAAQLSHLSLSLSLSFSLFLSLSFSLSFSLSLSLSPIPTTPPPRYLRFSVGFSADMRYSREIWIARVLNC